MHLGPSDVLGVLGSACWLIAWVQSRSEKARVGIATWPLMALLAGAISLVASIDLRGSSLGLIELAMLWVLPTLAVAGLFQAEHTRSQLLSSVSVGSLMAAVINIINAIRIGFSGGLPQVWGAADGFQGYFQVLGLAVAVPALITASTARKAAPVVLWVAAIGLHGSALLLTQTRGAWIAAVVAAGSMGLVWRRAFFAAAIPFGAVGLVVVFGTDWGLVIRERMLSVFRPEASLSGFDSSVIRIGLALTALNMFIQHPLTGIGLKNFPLALPYYAPGGLPLAVEMGPNQVLTPVLGPHSTYLSLLSETGILGGLAIVGWVLAAWWSASRTGWGERPQTAARRRLRTSLAAMVPTIAVFNLFGEMNASGTLPLVVFLTLALLMKEEAEPGSPL